MTASTSQSDAQLFFGAETHKAAVCQIVTGKKSGTGCLIGRSLLITNSHVIPNKEMAKSAEVFFLYNLSGSSYGAPFSMKLDPDTCFYTSPSPGANPFTASSLDFTVVALKGFEGHLQLEKIAKVALSILHDQDPQKGESILTIQHPTKRDEKTKLVGAQVFKKERVTELERFVIHYSGEKSQGGSGGAILNGDSKFVALHRGYCLKHKETNCKIGIRMQQILPALPKDVLALVRASQSSSLERAYLEDPNIKTLLATYIAPQGSFVRSCIDPFPLEQEVHKFLKRDKKVLLLQGGSGAGKTTFGKYLAYSLWKDRKPGDPICLFIPPSTTTNTNRAVEQTLSDHGFSQDEIQRLKKEERFVFIFDGYDEIGKKINLYQENRLADWNAKVIISCRTQYLSGSYASLFAPLRKEVPQHNLFRELWVTPFNDKQIDAYLQQYIKQDSDPIWTDYRVYRKYIDQIQGLKELISVPFLLHVIAEVLPEIVEKHQATAPDQKLKLLKVDLYDAFIAQWFNRAEVRLRRLGQLPDIEGDIKESFAAYCKKLAAEMFAKSLTVVTYKPPLWDEEPSSWAKYFGQHNPMIPLLINAAPLQKMGNSYSFLHKSLLEYFVYREDFDQLIEAAIPMAKDFEPEQVARPFFADSDSNFTVSDEQFVTETPLDFQEESPVAKDFESEQVARPFFADSDSNFTVSDEQFVTETPLDFQEESPGSSSALNKSSSKFPAEIAVIEETPTTQKGKKPTASLPENFATKLLTSEPAVIQFYADAVEKYPEFKNLLFETIELSKTDPSKAVAAANSITILNAARIPFSRMDLRGIRVPGANLYGANFDGAHLDGANLEDTILKDAFLRDCGLTKTQMKGVWFGERAYLKHDDQVNCVAYSPDGKKMVTASWDHTVWLWDVASGKEISILKGHTSLVRSCTFSPDGKTLVSASDDKTIRLWDVASGKKRSVLKGHTGFVFFCIFSPDGKILASASRDKTVRLWNVVSGKQISILKGHTGSVTSCTFSPDGKTLASASGDNTVRLWDVASGKKISVLKGHTGFVFSCIFSPDGKTLASASRDKTVRLWDVASGKEILILKGHTSIVDSCTFSPDGKTLVSASRDNTVQLWDVASGKEISVLKGHTDSVFSCTFSPDGKTLASASRDKTVRLWDVDSGREILILKGHASRVKSCTFSPDGKTLVSASYDNTIRLWDVASGKEISILKGHTDSVFSCKFSPDGKTLVSASYDNTIRLWDVASGKEISILKGHTDTVTSCTFSPDGKTLASISKDHTVRLWDVASGKEISVLKSYTETVLLQLATVTSCTFSPDGKILASASGDKTVRLWDVASGKEISILKGHTSGVCSCTFSPDGKTLASASYDRTVRLWDVVSGKEISILKGHTDSVESCTFSPDGKTLASASRDKTVRLWDVVSGKEISILKGHTETITSCTFSPDGKTLASASWDKTVRLWDVVSGKEISILKGHTDSVESCTFSPDGKTLASGSKDHTVRLWKLFNAKGALDPRMVWSSSPLLFVEGANLKNAQISEANAQLLFQRGAISSEMNKEQKIISFSSEELNKHREQRVTSSHRREDSPKRSCSIC